MSNTPSDEELQALWEESNHPLPQNFARAVLAKWGTSQQVVREPLTPSQYNIALGCATDIPPSRYEVVTRAIERAHGITQKGAAMLSDLEIEKAQRHLRIWQSLTSLPMVSHHVDFARAIEAEVRQQDDALIQQLVDALDDLTGAGDEAWGEKRPCVRIGKEAITAARARLGEKT